ncbi:MULTISPECIES: AAA family ATPase [Enorma]|uniref:Nucleotide kinase n=1 Tax=[Collinsella] massiliensis TaxID=1232426 RepID=A0A1Y3XX01_9ACTN|nr:MULTISPECIES: AAA family ATPase [Enorma]OUN88828.1 nucleotide kinase [[Collinsella] massiliensis]
MTKTLYLIGGPMGVGKTTVCRELNRLLPASVMLDGDWCWCANPFQVTPETKRMVLDNICHLLGNFLCCDAYENVAFCWVMHEQEIIDEILGRLPLEDTGARVRAISLVASEAALRERIERDIRAGARDEDALRRSLAYLPRYRALDTELIDTTGRTPHEIALSISARP